MAGVPSYSFLNDGETERHFGVTRAHGGKPALNMKFVYRLFREPLLPCTAIAAALVALAPASVLAQTTAPASSSTAVTGQTVEMEALDVDTVPLEQQILPSSRPFNSVFGFDDDIYSVPRNVTIVSRAQMDDINIQDVTQFSKLTASSYTDSDFGSPANPTIRGQPGDYFVNGMRQHVGDNGDGMPVDFNSMESVNIVPGPATAVQGASAYVGGYVDVVSKQPFFDGDHGFVDYTFGSYDTNRWTLDDGGPISPKLAYRFSYSGSDSDGYAYNWINQTTALYGAIAYRPNDTYELFMSGNVYIADYRENFGINRPTQALISNGLYQSGTNINNGTKATASDPQNALNVGGGPDGNDVIAWGPVVPIDYRQTAQGILTHSHGQEYNWQAIQTVKVSPALQIVNNSVFAYTKRDTYNSDGYNEVDDPTWFADNRTEFLFTPAKAEINAGLEERFQSVTDYTNFYFEPVNVWDLSSASPALRNDINFQESIYFPGTFGNVQIPGWPGRIATAGIINHDTNESELATVAPFVQATWKLSDQWSLVTGARIDLSHVGDKDPLTPDTEASVGFGEPNANISLVYKIAPTVSTYATYNFSENYTGDLADGGGFGLYSDANGNPTLPRSFFSEESDLAEYGVKFSTDGGKLFTTSDVFYQTRQSKPQGSPAIEYEFYGFETSANYQPNKYFYATLGYSWINGSLPASSDPFQAYDTSQIPGGPPNPFADPAAYHLNGRLRAPGQPLDLINALADYSFSNGFGIEANAVITSPMNNDYWGFLVIPWQYEIDGSIYYKMKKWEIRLSATNITNQHNWQANGGVYGLEGITAEPAFESYVMLKYIF
jgi:outer membrane receptor protein involved in Fe transport